MPGYEKKQKPLPSNRDRFLSQLESDIGYSFTNRPVLSEALTHPSYVPTSSGQGTRDNQRLEFFGNALLGFIVSDRLIKLYPESSEGSLTRMRESLVDRRTLADLAEGIRLDRLLRNRGKEKGRGRTKKSVLADAFEALVAAVYLDGGIDGAGRLVDRLFGPLLSKERMCGDVRDYKTKLQELSHSMRCKPPLYLLHDVAGPEGDLLFTVWVMVGDECFGKGTGKTRKEAEQIAAREGLLLLEEERTRRMEAGRKNQ